MLHQQYLPTGGLVVQAVAQTKSVARTKFISTSSFPGGAHLRVDAFDKNSCRTQSSYFAESSLRHRVGIHCPSARQCPRKITHAAASTSDASVETQQPLALHLLSLSWRFLRDNLGAIVLIHALCGMTTFVLSRVGQRLANICACALLGPSVTPAAIGNMWWLSTNPEISQFASGYQLLAALSYLLCLPLEVFLRSVAMTYTGAVISAPKSTDALKKGPFSFLRGISSRLSSVAPFVADKWRHMLEVDIRVAVRVIPLQYLSFLVLPLPFTLPRIVQLQLAQPIALTHEKTPHQALQESRSVMQPIQWTYAKPFLGLVFAAKVLEPLRGWVLTQMPMRFYSDLPEIPVLLVLAFPLASLLLNRLADVLPYAAYYALGWGDRGGSLGPRSGMNGAPELDGTGTTHVRGTEEAAEKLSLNGSQRGDEQPTSGLDGGVAKA